MSSEDQEYGGAAGKRRISWIYDPPEELAPIGSRLPLLATKLSRAKVLSKLGHKGRPKLLHPGLVAPASSVEAPSHSLGAGRTGCSHAPVWLSVHAVFSAASKEPLLSPPSLRPPSPRE